MTALEALAQNYAAIRQKYGPDIDHRRLPPGCAVAVPLAEWPPVTMPDTRLHLGVTCAACGADDWRQEKRGGPRCRPCDVRRCVEYQRLPHVAAAKAKKDRQRRARAALAGRVR